MSVTPTGIWSEPLDLLRTLLSECHGVQDLFGVTSSAEAKPLITLVGADASVYSLPCIVIGSGSYDVENIATGHTYRDNGELYMGIETPISPEYQGADTYGDAEFEHTNTVGAILAQMMALANDGGYLLVRRFRCPNGPERSDPKDGEFYQSIWVLSWGLEK